MKTAAGTAKNVVLITGASSGIGKALAELLAQKGWKVYGTSRNHSNNGDAAAGVKMVRLDVGDEASIDAAVNSIIAAEGRLDVLVNNAGFGIAGAIEDTSLEEAKSQFDTNFFGILSMCNRVLPHMREQGSGRIVNVSSVAGQIAIPFQSMYSASKFALEAMSEAMRIEVRPFGVKVCIIEPGDTKTGFTRNRQISKKSGHHHSPYRERFRKSIATMERDEMNGPEPHDIARVICKMIYKKNPPVRKVVGFGYKALTFLKRLLPARLVEFAVSKLYG